MDNHSPGSYCVILYFFRSKVIPYETKCRNCGAPLNMNQIFLYDANLCSSCDPLERPQEDAEEESDDTVESAVEDVPEEKEGE